MMIIFPFFTWFNIGVTKLPFLQFCFHHFPTLLSNFLISNSCGLLRKNNFLSISAGVFRNIFFANSTITDQSFSALSLASKITITVSKSGLLNSINCSFMMQQFLVMSSSQEFDSFQHQP